MKIDVDIDKIINNIVNIFNPSHNTSMHDKFAKLDNICDGLLYTLDEHIVKTILRKVSRNIKIYYNEQDLKYVRRNLNRKINDLYIKVI